MFKNLGRQLLQADAAHLYLPEPLSALELTISTEQLATEVVALEGLFGPSKEKIAKFKERRDTYVARLDTVITAMTGSKSSPRVNMSLDGVTASAAKLKEAVAGKKPDPTAFAALELATKSVMTREAAMGFLKAVPDMITLVERHLDAKIPVTHNELFKVVGAAHKAGKALSSKSPVGAYTTEDDARQHLAGAFTEVRLGVRQSATYTGQKGSKYRDAGYTADFPEQLLAVADRALADIKRIDGVVNDDTVTAIKKLRAHVVGLPAEKGSSGDALTVAMYFCSTLVVLTNDLARLVNFYGMNHSGAVASRIAKTYTE